MLSLFYIICNCTINFLWFIKMELKGKRAKNKPQPLFSTRKKKLLWDDRKMGKNNCKTSQKARLMFFVVVVVGQIFPVLTTEKGIC